MTTALRVHAGYDFSEDVIAEDLDLRRFGIARFGVSSVGHRFLKLTHVNRFERPEDINLGARTSAFFGVSTPALGGEDQVSTFYWLNASRGFALGRDGFLLGTASWQARRRNESFENSFALLRVNAVQKLALRKLVLAKAELRYGSDLDPEVQVRLGAESGLRGYPVRQFNGDRALLFSVEGRWFFVDDVANLVSAGVAAFADSGYAWAVGAPMRLDDLRSNVGASLLLGLSRGEAGRPGLRIDVAYALQPIEGRSPWARLLRLAHRVLDGGACPGGRLVDCRMDLSLIQVPYDSGHRDYRAGAGPAYLVDGGVRDKLTSLGHGIEEATIDASVTPTTEVATAFDLYRQLADVVRDARARERVPLVFAGNCNCVVGTLGGLSGELALAFFDAHGDFNTPETTSTGFLDGMGLAMATGRCWKAMAETIDGFEPIREARAIQIGGRDLDPLEKSALEESDATWLTVDEVRRGATESVFSWLSWEVPKPAVYVHVDMDVLDPEEARANRLATPGGLGVDELVGIVERIRDGFEVPALSVASVEPAGDEGGKTLAATIRLVEAMFPPA